MADEPADEDQTGRLARTAEFQRDLLQRAGGAFTTEKIRSTLGYKSAQAVNEAVTCRRLLVVDVDGTRLFPAFQFHGGSIVPGMADVLSAAPNTGPWELLQFFVAGDEGLGDDLPMDLIRHGPD
jgi:hypothetical protein